MMGVITVRKPDGSSISLMNKKGYSVITKAEQKCALMGEDTVTISVESKEHLGVSVGDTISIFGRRYTCNSLPSVKRAYGIFTTDMVFEGVAYDLLRVQFRKLDAAGAFQEGEFPLIGTLSNFTTLLIANIKRVLGSAWVLDLSAYTGTESKTISFNNENALAVLQRICEEFGQEFDITDDGSGYTIHIRKQGQVLNDVFEYGRGKGLYELTRKSVSNKALVTRLYVYGGKDNIKAGYRGYSERLKFSDAGYIDADSIKDFGIIEGTKIFEDIYPNRIGKVTALDADSINAFVDSTMDFDLKERDSNGTKWLIPGTTAKIHFNTGRLAGYEFEVTDYDHATKKFKIGTFKDERGDLYPSPKTEAFRVAAGDEYVILDIIMPDSYVKAAEAKLKDEAIKYLQQVSQPNVEYDVRVDGFYLNKKTGSTSPTYSYFAAGDMVQVKDTSMKVEKTVRLLSFSRDLLDPLEYQLELGDTVAVTRIERMLADISAHDAVIVQNDLGNPIKARRRARAAEELRNMVFDPEGYFNGERIKPLSIETMHLSVGSRSQNIMVSGLGISWVNRSDANAIKFNAGSITSLNVEENLRSWHFNALAVTLQDNDAYYIYARCSQSDNVGTVVLTKAQRKVDSEVGFYWILLGVLNSVFDGVREVKLTYGSTDVNGRFIRTGRLAGNGCFFDLDTGEIEGKVTFKSGSSGLPNFAEFPALSSSISSAQSTATSAASTASAANSAATEAVGAATEAKTKVDNLKVGGHNHLLNSGFTSDLSRWTNNVGTAERRTGDGYNGNNYVRINGYGSWIGIYQKVKLTGDYVYTVYTRIVRRDNTVNPLIGFSTLSIHSDEVGVWTKHEVKGSSVSDSIAFYITCGADSQVIFDVCMPMLEDGNTATGWSPNTKDLEAYADGKVTAEEQRAIADAQAKADAAKTAAIAAAAVDAQNRVDNIKIGGVNYIEGGDLRIQCATISANQAVSIYNNSNSSGNIYTTILSKQTSSTPGIKFRKQVFVEAGEYVISIFGQTDTAINMYLQNSLKSYAVYNVINGSDFKIYSKLFTVDATGYYDVYILFVNPAIDRYMNISWVQLEKGNKGSSDFILSQQEMLNKISASDYLKTALQNDTSINGGLVSTTMVKVGAQNVGGQWVEKCGINGAGTGDSTVRLWAGGTLQEAVSVASGGSNTHMTVITEGGKLFAVNAEISGKVNADSGVIGGFKINAGSMESNGSWNGGRFVLYPNDGYIAFLNNNIGVWAGIGANVFPASTGTRAVARFENCEANTWASNIGLFVRCENARQNFAIKAIGAILSDGLMTSYNLVEFMPSSAQNTLPIKRGVSFLINTFNSYQTVYLPTRSEVSEALGIGQSDPFAVRILIVAYRSNPVGYDVYAPSGCEIVNVDGGTWDHFAMGRGDNYEIMLVGRNSEYFGQVLNRWT